MNVALGAGISEVIEYGMAKDREERYQSAEQMLEDLRLVAAGEPPRYARRVVDFGSLADIEKSAQSQTIDVPPTPSIWEQPAVIALAAVAAASSVLSLILLAVVLS